MTTGYEKKDVNIKTIVGVSIFIIVLIAVMLGGLDEYFDFTKEKALYEYQLSPQSNELRELRASENQVLNNYKVLDKDKGIYQIPISQAMDLVVKEYSKN